MQKKKMKKNENNNKKIKQIWCAHFKGKLQKNS